MEYHVEDDYVVIDSVSESCSDYGTIYIPSIIEGLPVKVLGDGVHPILSAATIVKGIDLSPTIEKISDYACFGLESISSCYGSDIVSEIGINAFYGTQYEQSAKQLHSDIRLGKVLYRCYSTKQTVEISENVEVIGKDAFRSNYYVKKIVFGENVVSIEDGAFMDCSKLQSIVIPDTVTFIGDYVFEGCTALTSAEFGSGLQSIGADIFSGCTALKTVTAPSDSPAAALVIPAKTV